MKARKKWLITKVNYNCILFEGIANTMGIYLLGITTIVPLFLMEYGASLGLIGLITTFQSVAGALVPLFFGGIVARAVSKKNLSILVNGLTRGAILLVPLALLLGLPNPAIVAVLLFGLMALFLGGPFTGLSWNYLLNDCIDTNARPKLLGILFTTSGMIAFASSYFIKFIRDSISLQSNMKYFYIFGMAAIALASSVLFYIPLKESRQPITERIRLSIREYLGSLVTSFSNKDFRKLIWASVFSNIAFVLNAFLFVYADRDLALAPNLVSNLVIFQTIGIILGGIVTGQVSSRFGVKRMLLVIECMSLLIPVCAILCLFVGNPYVPICFSVSLLGFIRSGQLGYNNYIIEVVDKDKLITHMISKGLALLPMSFLSTAAGLYVQRHSMLPIFTIQIVASVFSIFMCSRLRLIKREIIHDSSNN